MGVKQLNGRGSWQVTLGSRYATTAPDEKTARMIEQSGKMQLALGKPLTQVITEMRGKPTTMTLDEFFEDWVATSGAKPQSIVRYRDAWKRLPSWVTAKPVSEVDASALRRTVKELSDAYAPNTVHQTVGVMKSVLIQASEEGLCSLPPRVKNLPRKTVTRKPFALTRKQHAQIVAATPEFYRDMVSVWPLVGLRRNEMLALTWDAYDGSRLHISDTKTGVDRWVDCCNAVRDTLDARERVCEYIFPSGNSTKMTPTAIGGVLREVGRKVGIDLHSHIFRHTRATWLIYSGAPITYIARQMGHTSAVLLSTYAHAIAEQEADASERFESWLHGDNVVTPE